MSNNKQNHIGEANKMLSSIDWLTLYIKGISSLNHDEVIQKAKAMHKEEVKTCMSVAFIDGARSNDENYKSPHEEWDDYYNEAFGGNK